MLREFKAFILRGNVVDLAVGVVIGVAFGAVIASFVTNILTPLIAIPGTADFSSYTATIGGGVFKYGLFINDVIAFVLIVAALFFLVVKPVNTLMASRKTGPEVESTTKHCTECLSSIPVGAKRCAFCGEPQTVAS